MADTGPRLTLRLSEEAYQHAKREADAAGLSVQEWLERSARDHAKKMFPDAFRGKR